MLLAFSLFYTGGMFLNDAFDAEFDAAQRPERPIPSGEISGREVFGYAYCMMAGGVALLAWIGAALMLCYLIGLTYVAKQENLGKVENLWPLAFLAAPVAYGAWLAVAQAVVGLFWLLFSGWMLVALWFLRRRRKGDIPRAVVSLIAGISLLDAMLIAGTGSVALAVLALAGFGVTLFFQRYIAGT